MKKILIFCFLLTILTTNSVFAWTDNLSIGIDGYDGVYIDIYKSIAPFSSDKANLLMINNEFSDDKPPVIISGRALIPIRIVSDKLGANIKWNSKTKEITIKNNTNTCTMNIGSTIAVLNGKTINLDTAPIIISNIAYVPIRNLSSILNVNVGYRKCGYGSVNIIWISNKNEILDTNQCYKLARQAVFNYLTSDNRYEYIESQTGKKLTNDKIMTVDNFTDSGVIHINNNPEKVGNYYVFQCSNKASNEDFYYYIWVNYSTGEIKEESDYDASLFNLDSTIDFLGIWYQ